MTHFHSFDVLINLVLKKKSFKSFSQMPIESITVEERKAVNVPPPKLNPYPQRCLSPISPRKPVKRKVESPPSQVVPAPPARAPISPQRPQKKPRAYQPFKPPRQYGRPVAQHQSTRTKRLGTWAPYGKTDDFD